jgi:hypothetical protein
MEMEEGKVGWWLGLAVLEEGRKKIKKLGGSKSSREDDA